MLAVYMDDAVGDVINGTYYVEYGKCTMDIHYNNSNSSLTTSIACPDGYSYVTPKDRSIATEVHGYVLTLT
jgi:hypothetical protein